MLDTTVTAATAANIAAALVRVLIQKGVITEAEADQMLNGIISSAEASGETNGEGIRRLMRELFPGARW